MRGRSRCPGGTYLSAIFVALTGVFLAISPAVAGPGGIIKMAAETTVGRIVLGLLAILFLPWLIYYYVRRGIRIRRTTRDLALLGKTYPRYRWLDAKDRVTDTFTWVWSAWSRQKMEAASPYTTHWYWQNQQLKLDDLTERGLENVCRLVKIVNIVPIFVQHIPAEAGEGSRLVVDITARVVDYVRERASGKIVQGDANEGDLETIWTFVWEKGAWRLNLIEDSSEEWTYLRMTNETDTAPASPPVPAPAR